MKLAVVIRQSPDPTVIRLDPQTGEIEPGAPLVIGEYDLVALEEALRLRDEGQDLEIVVLSVGATRDALTRALAMGADSAVSIDMDQRYDSFVTAGLLAAFLERERPDAVFAGQQSADGGSGAVGPQLAALLRVPVVTNVVDAELADGAFTLRRELETGRQVVRVQPPAVLCFLSSRNQPRFPSMRGIIAARKKPLREIPANELGLPAQALTPVVSWGRPFVEQESGAGTVVSGDDPEAAAEQLIAFLKERGWV